MTTKHTSSLRVLGGHLGSSWCLVCRVAKQRRMRARVRCPWAGTEEGSDYVRYHDEEWGVPVHDDRLLFEFLILEGAQAGLSWSTILRKRAAYRTAFANFEAAKVARFGAADVRRLLADPGIVRNRLKVSAAIDNARAALA